MTTPNVGSSTRAESMRCFFEPQSIAVIGASPNPTRGGHRILENLLTHFEGSVYPVNPNADHVLERRCYGSVLDVPDDVDLAVVFVPASLVPAIVRECVEKGVRAVCVESGGFADAGRAGEDLQRDLVRAAAGTATRLWGPNCAGYVSSSPPLSTSFVVTPGTLRQGNVALVAQSGMMAAALLVQVLSQELFSISKACSIGNKCDVDESDLLELLAEDDQTEVTALYLESIVDGRRFTAAVDELLESSVVVALIGGLSDSGKGAAVSHTGSVAVEESVVCGLLRQHGVLQARDFMELVDLVGPLASLRRRRCGHRVAVLTFSGAGGVVSADLLSRHGLELAELAPATIGRLAALYPEWLEPRNPVDLWSTVELRGLGPPTTQSLDALADDPGVDAILFMPLAFDFFDRADVEAIAAHANRSAKPIVAWPFGDEVALSAWRSLLSDAGVAVCRSLEVSVRVLEALVLRSRALRRRHEPLHDGPAAPLGIPGVPELRATTPGEAVAAAEALGYPVAVKLLGVDHKTDVGGVALDVRDEAGVRAAAERFDAPVVVQSMVEGGVEFLVGGRRDPRFGNLVVVGQGGVHVEALRDVAVRQAPLTESDARQMIEDVRAARLLEGGRGAPARDRDAVVAALLAMSSYICSAPSDVREVEVNPLIVRHDGVAAVDLLVVREEGL